MPKYLVYIYSADKLALSPPKSTAYSGVPIGIQPGCKSRVLALQGMGKPAVNPLPIAISSKALCASCLSCFFWADGNAILQRFFGHRRPFPLHLSGMYRSACVSSISFPSNSGMEYMEKGVSKSHKS